MARMRLFANLREAAGTGSAVIDGATVGDVLAEAVARFGPDFARGLDTAAIWVNGDPATLETRVGPADEVALIPPVSGGAMVVRSPAALEAALIAVVAAALFLANAISVQWLAVTVVLAAGVWAFDLAEVATRRGLLLAPIPVLTAVLGGVLATYRFGVPGMAAAGVGAILVAASWSVAVPRFRPIESVAATAVVSAVAALGTGSMVLLRLRSEDEMLAFLVIVTLSTGAAWTADLYRVPMLDPLLVGILGAVVGGVIAALLWFDDPWAALVAAGGVAVALVAGRNLGTLLRAGGFFVEGPVPGSLHAFDAILLAAGTFWLLLDLLA
jgi:molybdopterin converting factor small subunit